MDNPVVLGVDFGGSKVAVAAADVAGARSGLGHADGSFRRFRAADL